MATEQNNIHINSFTKGMNSDTSYDMISNELYVFGLNIRITTNALLKAISDSNNKEGIITPVGEGSINTTDKLKNSTILGTASIENIGAVVIENNNNLIVYKVEENNGELTFTEYFKAENYYKENKVHKTSLVINKEQDKVLNLYIATGYDEVMVINLLEKSSYYDGLTVDDIISNHLFPSNKVYITDVISGTLKTQQLQYTYRLYKKHGICSKIAPLTNKLLVIDSNRNKETGNAEDTTTSKGFALKVIIPDDLYKVFDHILLFRISYIKPDTDPTISLIFDTKLYSSTREEDSTDPFIFTLNDTGIDSVQDYSVEEFSALSSLDLIPQIIELNLNYLFLANTEDKTVSKLTANNDIQVTTKLITTKIPLHDKIDFTSTNSYPNITNNNLTKVYNITDLNGNVIEKTPTVSDYLTQNNINDSSYKHTYEDMICSSMFRSLGRDEYYRYGIVYYDKYGRRTDVNWLKNDIYTENSNITKYEEIIVNEETGETNKILYAKPIGILFNITGADDYVGCLIVRCAKDFTNTKNLLQVALSRPIRQYTKFDYSSTTDTNDKFSPYYPNIFLTSQITNSLYDYIYPNDKISGDVSSLINTYKTLGCFNDDNIGLFQIFSPEINLKRNTTLENLTSADINMSLLTYSYGCTLKEDNDKYSSKYSNDGTSKISIFDENIKEIITNDTNIDFVNTGSLSMYSAISLGELIDGKITYSITNNPYKKIIINKSNFKNSNYNSNINSSDNSTNDKLKLSFSNLNYQKYNFTINPTFEILKISDVKNPTWELGFSNISLSGSNITNGLKQYKSYSSNIYDKEYVNWICNGKYDLQIVSGVGSSEVAEDQTYEFIPTGNNRTWLNAGWIGAGPLCLLVRFNSESSESSRSYANYFGKNLNIENNYHLGSLIGNIYHTIKDQSKYTTEEKQYDTYYGFGNYCKLDNGKGSICVFDGDKYITPCEFVNMFKTYDFNSADTLSSSQMIYYIPLESTINTYFDYGMNYRNTQSNNLQLEPGEITGVATQDRPLNLYNDIYSDNNYSIDTFNAKTLEDSTDKFTQRIHYSALKTSGENIDSWGQYQSLNYIDTDTRYGLLTELLTNKDVLYYWLTGAFGKLSVNERSLVTDNNSNTILLGQGGVLQRTDYINTRYGMKEYDHSAISAEGVVYWIDILNKAIIMSNGQQCINYSEKSNVQNIVNEYMTDDVPYIHYDVLNNELICKCLDGNQLIFNLKLDCASSVYTRDYKDIILFNNVLYGLTDDYYIRYNYLETYENILSPSILSFVVNPSSSTTKVFDSLEVVTLNRGEYTADYYLDNKTYKFTTNICNTDNQPDGYTDREGNIKYTIPRYGSNEYGNRIRGKWMKVDITDDKPLYKESISHVLTKFRQSFS